MLGFKLIHVLGFKLIHVSKRGPRKEYIDGIGQECNNSSVLGMELLQSSTKPSIYQSYKPKLHVLQYYSDKHITLVTIARTIILVQYL